MISLQFPLGARPAAGPEILPLQRPLEEVVRGAYGSGEKLTVEVRVDDTFLVARTTGRIVALQDDGKTLVAMIEEEKPCPTTPAPAPPA